ncbi:zinc finger protein interacting with ribonucleoprotein K-like isoform X2 [Diorhabda carinulata]|uniref:zinc finger protein interacting with ribonucleoprotein K-like isoform X2 n=1 Tax=Diorhabda carinulata TaxID=1163345 RepID=UPI0025A0A45E|nr:zinc finger protein interacting with ribonucleoprotein K-like isoform X2 [Diorhabda carinulata]
MEKNNEFLFFDQHDYVPYNFDTNTRGLPISKDVDLPSNVLETSNNFSQNECNLPVIIQDLDLSLSLLEKDDNKVNKNKLHGENSSLFNIKYIIEDEKSVKLWECGFCKKMFHYQYMLMRHLPTHTNERKFQCLTCGKAFRQMSTLSQHRVIHSTERPKTHTDPKPHRCHLCPRAFHIKGNLQAHIYTHTNEIRYKCDVCGKGFIQMSNLMRHRVKIHQRTDKFNSVSQACDELFPKMDILKHREEYGYKLFTPSLSHSPDKQLMNKTDHKDGIVIEPIETVAMRRAIESNRIPYALLHPAKGEPVLVKVLPAGDKQILVPVMADNLKKHSHISVTSQVGEDGKLVGETVKMRIPIVAILKQQSNSEDPITISIADNEPHRELSDETRATNFESTSSGPTIDDVFNENEDFFPEGNYMITKPTEFLN